MVAVGFCEDRAPLHRMLGREPGSWGFHSDDGRLYEDGGLSWRGIKYHEPYEEKNVTIGCGVNFAKSTAFYTKDGEVIE
ncbi:hypothetical protein CEP51_001284 [Fusarium floridanum]|uniref:B30.2/SPRY domain-containing protein n=1 Tax=Fusarium floridanum TaxID=1325733 RepID=A0A428SHL3_9HYPO|nr:hypothetical protein CEP51_001284 [Fusarium floridanum]